MPHQQTVIEVTCPSCHRVQTRRAVSEQSTVRVPKLQSPTDTHASAVAEPGSCVDSAPDLRQAALLQGRGAHHSRGPRVASRDSRTGAAAPAPQGHRRQRHWRMGPGIEGRCSGLGIDWITLSGLVTGWAGLGWGGQQRQPLWACPSPITRQSRLMIRTRMAACRTAGVLGQPGRPGSHQ